jgi:hypothetical protein
MVKTMPIQIGIMCERCGRVYVVATSKRIRRDKRLGADYRLTCESPCGAIRYFTKNELQPYVVSAYVVKRGFAERNEYEPVREP